MSSYGIWNGFMWGQTIYRCYLSLIGNNSGQHQSALQIGAKQNCLVVSVCWNRGSTIACLTHIVWWCGAHLGNFAFFSMHISVNAFDYPVHPTLLRQANTTSRVRCQNSVYAFHMLLVGPHIRRTDERTNEPPLDWCCVSIMNMCTALYFSGDQPGRTAITTNKGMCLDKAYKGFPQYSRWSNRFGLNGRSFV